MFFIVGILLTLCLIDSSLSDVTQRPGQCKRPNKWITDVIDLEKISGTWYVVLGNNFEKGSYSVHCEESSISPSPLNQNEWLFRTIGIKRDTYSENVWKMLEIWMHTNAGTEPGTWRALEITSTIHVGENRRKGWALAIDYGKYYVGYSCREDKYAGTYDGNIFVYARSRILCNQDWQNIFTTIYNSGVFDLATDFPLVLKDKNCPNLETEGVVETYGLGVY